MEENRYSLDVPVGIQKEEVKNMELVKDAEVVNQPRIKFENVETYKLALSSMREELIGLIKEGQMSEVVAERLLNDFMYNTFSQVVKLKFE